MSYELKREDIFEFARFIGADAYEKGDELTFKRCPKCGGGRNGRDEETFSVNLNNGAFCCLRSSCDYRGHFVELARDFDFPLEFEKPRSYKQLKQPDKPLQSTDKAVEYLRSRGISETVCKQYEITTLRDHPNTLVFPFFDENGTLRYIKYRNTDFVRGSSNGSKEWSERDTMPILFGMKQCTEPYESLIVTEGQIDSLSVAEAGIPNAVSVPTGALGATWVIPCYDFVSRFKEIIVFGDYENGKITLVDMIRARFDGVCRVKVVRKKDYLGEKDANDILRKYGTDAIWKAVANAEEPQIENVKELSTVKSVDINEIDKIRTGIKPIDKVIGGYGMGQLIVLSGRAGEGKSTFLSQTVASALEQGETVFVYSGELADFHFKRILDLQLAGDRNITMALNEYNDETYSINEDTVKAISRWYKGRAYVYDNDYLPANDDEIETLPETIEKVIKQYGVRLICVDNLMTAMDGEDAEKNGIFVAQSRFVGRLKKIAVKYQVAIVLVSHPKKTAEKEFTNDTVSGSSDITNKADTVLCFQRDTADGGNDSCLAITKNRLFGNLRTGDNAIKLYYSPKSRRIRAQYDDPNYKYGWERDAESKWQDIPPNGDLPF